MNTLPKSPSDDGPAGIAPTLEYMAVCRQAEEKKQVQSCDFILPRHSIVAFVQISRGRRGWTWLVQSPGFKFWDTGFTQATELFRNFTEETVLSAFSLYDKRISPGDFATTMRGSLANEAAQPGDPLHGHYIIATEAAMFYPSLTDEIEQLIRELEARIKALHALQIDQEEDMQAWDLRVELINRIRLFKKDLARIKESF